MTTLMEHSIQAAAIDWLRMHAGDDVLVFAIPNGGLRNKRVAVRLREEGVTAGVADICIIEDSRVLFIEMKTRRGSLSDVQKGFEARARRANCHYRVCRSLQDVKDVMNVWSKCPARWKMITP